MVYVCKNITFKKQSSLELSTLDFVATLESNSDIEKIGAAFHNYVASLGFTNAACITLPEAGDLVDDSVLMNSRPDEWSNEYIARDCVSSDPMVHELFRTYHPFAWSDVTGTRKLKKSESAVMELAREFEMDCGFVVPIFDTSGNTGLISIAGLGVNMDEQTRGALTLASTYVHNRLCTMKRKSREDDVRMTGRELEVLKWISAGKSDWQIGQILNISAKTVNYHVENVKRKFGVATRIQAVVAAMRQGKLVH